MKSLQQRKKSQNYKINTTAQHIMANTSDVPKPNGSAVGDNFESLGKKAENLTISDSKAAPATSGDLPTLEDGDDQKVVDEIESLCMNCHENVSHRPLTSPTIC